MPNENKIKLRPLGLREVRGLWFIVYGLRKPGCTR